MKYLKFDWLRRNVELKFMAHVNEIMAGTIDAQLALEEAEQITQAARKMETRNLETEEL